MSSAIDRAMQQQVESLQEQASTIKAIKNPRRCFDDFEFYYQTVFIDGYPQQFPWGVHQRFAVRFITWPGHGGSYPDKRLIVMPPGSGKSNIVSKALASWIAGRDPESPTVLVTSTTDLATQRSLWLREVAEKAQWFRMIFPDVRPYQAMWRADNWVLLPTNRRFPQGDAPTLKATGTDASIGGIRIKYAILDDLHNQKNSATPGERANVKNWYYQQLKTRLSGMLGGWQIMLANIWHGDDLTSELWGSGQFAIMHMRALYPDRNVYADVYLPPEFGDAGPAFADWCEVAASDYTWDASSHKLRMTMHRQGPALWPEIMPEGKLQEERKLISPARFDRVWNGERMTTTGGVYKQEWFRHYDPEKPPAVMKDALMSWDSASESSDRNDYTAGGLLWIGADNNLYVEATFREKLDSGLAVPLAIPVLWLLARRDGINVRRVLLEKATYSRSVIHTLRLGWTRQEFIDACNKYTQISDSNPTLVRLIRGLLMDSEELPDIIKLPLKEVKVRKGGKAELHEDAAPYYANGNVFHAVTMQHLDILEGELATFPTGQHDDLADLVAQAVCEVFSVAAAKRRRSSGRQHIFIDLGAALSERPVAINGSERRQAF